MATSENEDYEYYAYSSDEDGYPVEEGGDLDGDSNNSDMEWNANENPNAPPTTFARAPIAAPVKSGIRMMAPEELRPEMKRRLQDVTDVLDVPNAAAVVLLREHNWSKEHLLEVYMANADNILKKCGVYARCGHSVAPKPTKTCEICYENVEVNNTLAMPCGHAFCIDCWHDFCVNAVREGPVCVKTTCPEASCNEVVTEDEMTRALQAGSGNGSTGSDNASTGTGTGAAVTAGTPELEKFLNFQLRSFVESNKLTRWCPGRGCERIAFAVSASAMEAEGNVAHCDSCFTNFCLLCASEPHSPAWCKDLAKWNEKCRNESETANWILANTKSCPKCVSRIEKNQGCNHMTCQRCKFEFCWICMGDWHDHGANTGGYYKCNKYETSSPGGAANPEDQSDAAKAKRDLDRYLHYYKRFHAHQEAQMFAKRSLKETEARMVLLQESSDDAKWSDVEFLKMANEQLVECRRVLKYTYVFAYYLDPRQGMQRERFEHHQEMLERFTENLSELSEKPLLEMDRTDVVNQTRVVDRFMKNILKYVEEGMEE